MSQIVIVVVMIIINIISIIGNSYNSNNNNNTTVNAIVMKVSWMDVKIQKRACVVLKV